MSNPVTPAGNGPPITIYTSAICPYCVAAKNFLSSQGRSWTEVRIDIEPDARQKMVALTRRTSVPQIFVGDTHVGGYDDMIALHRAGGLQPLLERCGMSGPGNAGAEQDRIAEFTAFRKRMNERILAEPNQVVRRFFALDTQTYQPGALDVKTKELLGLVASMVLRCDDCISYHVAQCREAGVSREEMFEAFSVGLVVGGSIVIPHMRRAVDFLDRLEQGGASMPDAHAHAHAS